MQLEEEMEDGGVDEVSAEKEEPALDPGLELYRGRPSWVNYWGGIFLGAAGVIAGIVCFALGVAESLWILFGGLVLALLVYSYICVMRSMWLYVVTPRRVEVIYGLITKNSNEVRVQDIRAINVKKEGFKGLIGVGSVEFASAGSDEAEVKFRDVWGAQKVKTIVRKLQDAEDE